MNSIIRLLRRLIRVIYILLISLPRLLRRLFLLVFCTVYVIGSLSIKANAAEVFYPSSEAIYAYSYFISKGLTKLNTSISNPASDGTPLSIESWTGSYYDKVGGQIFLYQKTTSSFITFPWISGKYNYLDSYDANNTIYSLNRDTLYMEFFSSQPIYGAAAFFHPNDSGGQITADVIARESLGGATGGFYHYILRFTSVRNYFSINIHFANTTLSVVPVMMKFESKLTNDERMRVGLPSLESSKINNLTTQSKEQFEKQIAQEKKHHEEMMDTSESDKVGGIADSLVKTGNEKTKSLLYPVQWAIDTAHNLASAPSTGTISIPVIFGSGTFDIDLTVLERNVPSVWSFIQNFIRFVVAIGILRGIFGLFKGVDG